LNCWINGSFGCEVLGSRADKRDRISDKTDDFTVRDGTLDRGLHKLEQKDILADKPQRGKNFDEESKVFDAEAYDESDAEDEDARAVDGTDNVGKDDMPEPTTMPGVICRKAGGTCRRSITRTGRHTERERPRPIWKIQGREPKLPRIHSWDTTTLEERRESQTSTCVC